MDTQATLKNISYWNMSCGSNHKKVISEKTSFEALLELHVGLYCI